MSVPRLFGPYLLLHELAKGSTAEVYLARTMGEFGRLCTVKIIRPELVNIPEFKKRFKQDAALLVRLIHGNLVQVLEVGKVEEQFFIAMEYIDGIDLPELLAETEGQDPLPAEVALYVGLEICEALHYIHLRRRESTGSRSFSADTPWALEVMLSFDGVVKVVDLGSFGAVRLGKQKVSRLFRSPGYAVPEVVRKELLDERSDVFAVGMVVWELLTGHQLVVPDARTFVSEVLSGSWKAPLIERRDVPGDVIRVVAGMLSLDPRSRPSTLEEVRDPLVNGLRRLAPAYGSAALSEVLWRRCQGHIAHMEDVVANALDGEVHEPSSGSDSTSLSFGVAGEVDREISEPVKLEMGEIIPGTRYKMLRLLGKGWSGEVYAVQHTDLERQLAIKVLSPDLARRSKAIEVFRMEARACSRVGHPNIVDVIDFGELADGRFYFAMELLEGESLARLLKREGVLPPERVVGIVRQVAKALQAVHASGIVHRDLKPQNIMLIKREGKEDFVKILDFGAKAFTKDDQKSARVGTTGYMAPEMGQKGGSTPAVDIYSTGVIMYQALSGELPYESSSYEAFATAQASGPPPALRSRPRGKDVPDPLERVVHRALERDPAARHPSMADLEEDLIKAQQEAGLVSAYDDLPGPSKVKDRRRVRARSSRPRGLTPSQWVVSGAAIGALLVIILIVSLSQSYRGEGGSTADAGQGWVAGPAPHRGPADAGLAPNLRSLLEQAEQAAARGQFTSPRERCALDLLAAVEHEAGPGPVAPLRERYARLLEGAADRLVAAGMQTPAVTLYREAFLFDFTNQRLEKLAYPESPDGGPRKTPDTSRPEASAAEVAWLLSRIQLAVAEGRYLSPTGNNALDYLRRLKRLDPQGARSEAAQAMLSEGLRRQAEVLSRQGKELLAQEYRDTLRDLLSAAPKTRSADARVRPAPGSNGSSPSQVPPQPAVDRTRARELLALGRKAMGQGQLDEARTRYTEALRVDPGSSAALEGLAQVSFEKADYHEAVELCQKALRLKSYNPRVYLLLGDAHFNLLRHKDAQKAWLAGQAQDPKSAALASRLKKLEEKLR